MPWYTAGGNFNPINWGDESASSKQKRNDLNYQGSEASGFANEGQDAFNGSQGALDGLQQMLTARANGQQSLSAEQLRQGLMQNAAQVRSMAAGASPANAAGAARAAMIQGARLGYGMSGQAATAGLQEQQQAQDALGQLLLQRRQQELQRALGSRQNAMGAYGAVTPDKSWLDKYGQAIVGGITAAVK